MDKLIIFAIKDSRGMYTGANSICFVRKKKQWRYTSTQYIANGFIYYSDIKSCEKEVNILNELAKEIGFDIIFKVDEIVHIDIIKKESEIGIPKYQRFVEYIKLK